MSLFDQFGVVPAAMVFPRRVGLSPNVQILTDGQSDPLLPALIASGKARVKHPPATARVWIGGDVHRPEHQVVPASGIANKQRVVHTSPIQSVVADRMGHKIVVRQHEVEQVIKAAMIQDVNITDRLAAPT